MDSSNILFLGNYTNHESSHNLECLIYLICMKILSPCRVHLIRGLNEMVDKTQLSLTHDLMSDPASDVILTLLVDIFESLPVACTVDNQLFAAHSGIPKNNLSIIEIKSTQCWSSILNNNVPNSKLYNNYYSYSRVENNNVELYKADNKQSWLMNDKSYLIMLFDDIMDELLQVVYASY